jgi:hypothetical protein
MLTDETGDDLSGVDAYPHLERYVKTSSGLSHGIDRPDEEKLAHRSRSLGCGPCAVSSDAQ